MIDKLIFKFDMLLYSLFYWRWNRRLVKDVNRRTLLLSWLTNFERRLKHRKVKLNFDNLTEIKMAVKRGLIGTIKEHGYITKDVKMISSAQKRIMGELKSSCHNLEQEGIYNPLNTNNN